MSEKTAILIAVLAVAAVVGAGAITILMDSDKEYSITYELNGGENSDLNPTSYTSGKTYFLHEANTEDKYFYAWYLDADYNNICEKIDADMEGDITLFAKWSDTLEGKGMTLSISGQIKTGFFTAYEISGTESFRYMYYDDDSGKYFVANNSLITYKSGFSQQTKDSESSYWSGESDTIWTFDGMETITTSVGDKLCEKYVGTDSKGSFTNIQYIGDDWIVYYMTYESSEGGTRMFNEYFFVETFAFDVSSEYNIIAYADEGINVTGAGTYTPGDKVTLNATTSSGTTFKGWYDQDMKLLSTNKTYTVEVVGADVMVFALNTDDPDHSFESDIEISLSSGKADARSTWRIVNSDSGETAAMLVGQSPSYTFTVAGEYEVFIEGGSNVLGYYTILVNGEVERTFEWKYDGKTYNYSLSIEYADLLSYRTYYTPSERAQGTTTHNLSFVTYTDPYIKTIASDFAKMTEGMSDVQVANFILAFTQYIEYQDDGVHTGYTEYWKFPLETLFDQGGDCEDTAFLYCAIAKAMGYDTALFLLPGHMASGIALKNFSGDGFTLRSTGVTYYYCETTSVNYNVGKNPNTTAYNSYTVTVMVV